MMENPERRANQHHLVTPEAHDEQGYGWPKSETKQRQVTVRRRYAQNAYATHTHPAPLQTSCSPQNERIYPLPADQNSCSPILESLQQQ